VAAFKLYRLIIKCEECDHVLVGDEVEYLYKCNSYCEDCYKTVKGGEDKLENLVLELLYFGLVSFLRHLTCGRGLRLSFLIIHPG
jgi:hypothetical protein